MLNTFDDFLIKPRFSTIGSRSECDTSNIILAANMDCITGVSMVKEMRRLNQDAVLHRFCTHAENMDMVRELNECGIRPTVSIGLGNKELDRAVALLYTGADIICIDTAHAAQINCVNQVRYLLDKLDDPDLIVGNFATSDSLLEFINHLGITPAEFFSKCRVKVGIGPGSACLTREKTGVGVPQIAAIMDISEYIPESKGRIIADGGIRNGGDIAKALLAGASQVMIGGLLAGTSQANTPWLFKGSAYREDNKRYKASEGTSFNCSHIAKYTYEVINDLTGGLASAMSYTGSRNLTEFKTKGELILVSGNTLTENNLRRFNND